MEKKGQSSVEKGKKGEDVAVEFLEGKGYKILARGWRMGSMEVDIIAEKEQWLVFAEVKTRYSDKFGGPWEAVNAKKRRNIIFAADCYIRRNNIDKNVRFDIISILQLNGKSEVQHMEDAFYPMA